MEAANQILETLIRTKNLQHQKTPSMTQRNLRDTPSPAAALRQQEYAPPPKQPSTEAVSAAATSYGPTQSPLHSPPQAQRQNLPPRTSSVDPAAQAAAIATGARPPSQHGMGKVPT